MVVDTDNVMGAEQTSGVLTREAPPGSAYALQRSAFLFLGPHCVPRAGWTNDRQLGCLAETRYIPHQLLHLLGPFDGVFLRDFAQARDGMFPSVLPLSSAVRTIRLRRRTVGWSVRPGMGVAW